MNEAELHEGDGLAQVIANLQEALEHWREELRVRQIEQEQLIEEHDQIEGGASGPWQA
jgi:predicted RNase H-like HicB family nuclease